MDNLTLIKSNSSNLYYLLKQHPLRFFLLIRNMKIDAHWFFFFKSDYWHISINLEIKITMRKSNCLKSNYTVTHFTVYIHL